MLPKQELGGWVYEKAYLNFRYPPAEGLTGEALDTYLEDQMGSILAALDDILVPSPYDHLAYSHAVDLIIDYERYKPAGFPSPGGYAEQDSLDMYVLDCILTARERAERETRAGEAKMRNQQSGSGGLNENEIETSDLGSFDASGA